MIILVLVEIKRRIVVAYILGQCYFYYFSSLFAKENIVFIILYNRLTEELKDNGGGEVDCSIGSVRFGDDALGLVPIKIVDGRVGDEIDC